MRVQRYFYFLFFICSSASSSLHQNQIDTIPPIKIKATEKHNHSLTSGPKKFITKQQLQTAGVRSIAQALQNLGGLQLHDLSGTGSQVVVSMRGFGSNATSNTLILINGIPIINPDIMPPDLNTIPLNQIEYIEIISGSESVLYGDQAVGGVINLVTQKKIPSELFCSFGSYNLKNCFASLHQEVKNLNYNLTIANNQTSNYREHNHFDQQLLFGNFLYSYPTGRFNFNYRIANENLQYPGALSAAQVFQNRRQANNSTDYFRDWNGDFHFNLEQIITDNWRLQTDLMRREMHGHGVLRSPFNQSRLTYFLTPQIKGNVGNTLIISGADFEEDHYHLSSLFGLTDNSQHKYGLFALANIPIYSPIMMSIGARGAEQNDHLISFSSSDTINRAFATTLGFTWPIMQATQMYVRRAESFRFPKADENAFAPIGVTSLRTERGVAYESGIEMNKEKYAGKFEIFQLNLRDEIAFDPTQTPEQPFGSNRNLAPTIRRGASVSGRVNLIDRFNLDGQYNFVNARFQNGPNAGNRIPLVAENIVRIGLDYHLTENWNLYTEGIFTGNQYPDNDDANIAGKIGGYSIFNFNCRYQFKNLQASLQVNNVFNKYYYLYTVYQSSMNTESFYPAPDRNLLVTVRYVFT